MSCACLSVRVCTFYSFAYKDIDSPLQEEGLVRLFGFGGGGGGISAFQSGCFHHVTMSPSESSVCSANQLFEPFQAQCYCRPIRIALENVAGCFLTSSMVAFSFNSLVAMVGNVFVSRLSFLVTD